MKNPARFPITVFLSSFLALQHYSVILGQRTRLELLKEYDKLTVPTSKDGQDQNSNRTAELPTNILTTVSVSSLTVNRLTIADAEHSFELEGWMMLHWTDYRLVWSSSDSNNESINNKEDGEKMHFSPEEIWVPDLRTFNSVRQTGYYQEIFQPTQCLVSKEGKVSWGPPCRFLTRCDLNIRRWPRDIQICRVQLGSWTYDVSQLVLNFDPEIPTADEDESLLERILKWNTISNKTKPEWEVLETKVYSEVTKSDGFFKQSRSSLNFDFTIQRKSTIDVYTFALPIILISFLNLVLFLKPVESLARITVGALIFLVLSIYLIVFRMRLPQVDHVPYLVILYRWNLVLSSVNIISSVFLSNLNKVVGSGKPPLMIRHIYNPSLMSVICLGYLLTSREKFQQSVGTVAALKASKRRSGDESTSVELSKESGVSEGLIISSGRQSSRVSEWELLAATIDRLSMIVYTTITLILLACLL